MKIDKRKIIYAFSFLVLFIIVIALLGVFPKGIGMCIALVFTIVLSGIIAYISLKNKIEFVGVIMLIIIALSLVLLVMNFKYYNKIKNLDKYKFQVTVEPSEKEKTYLFTYNNKTYYSYKVQNIKVIMDETGKEYNLKDALDNKVVTFDEILGLAAPSTNTTGYKIYYDGGQEKYDNDKYSIVVCEGSSNEVIFSTFDYKYQEDICK